MEDIERIHVEMGAAWPGTSRATVGDWVLRFGGGYTGRANSALPVGDPGMPLPDALDAVAAAYRERGLAPRYQVPCALGQGAGPGAGSDGRLMPVRADVDAALAARGYEAVIPVLVMVADGAGDAPGALPESLRAEWSDEPTPGWEELCSERYHRFACARAVTTACPARYLTLWEGDSPVARGRAARAGELCDVSDLLVVERVRGRGLGRWMMAALRAEGVRLGAARGVLQVEEGNAVARSLYASSGWHVVGGYRYRVLPR